MKPKRMLILSASATSLVLTLGHALGGLGRWLPVEDNAELALLGSMEFDVHGSQRSMLDLYFGFGVIIGVLLLQQTILIAMASSRRTFWAAESRSILLLCIFTCVPSAIVSWVYLFIAPAICFTAISILLLIALMVPPRLARRNN